MKLAATILVSLTVIWLSWIMLPNSAFPPKEKAAERQEVSIFNSVMLPDDHWKSYDLSLAVSSSYDPQLLLASGADLSGSKVGWKPKSIESRLTGMLLLSNPDQSNSGKFTAVMKKVRISLATPYQGDTTSIEAQFAKPIEVFVNSKGLIESISFHPSTNILVKNTWAIIVSQLQVSLPDNGDPSKPWYSVEEDYLSKYSVRYSQQEDEGITQLSKVKTKILSVAVQSMSGPPATKLAPSNRWTAEFKDKSLAKLSARDGLVLLISNKQAYKNDIAIDLELSKENPDRERLDALVSQSRTSTPINLKWKSGFSNEISKKAAMKNSYLNDLQSTSISTILSTVQKKLNKEERISIYKKIRAYAYLNPNKVDKFLHPLVNGKYNGNANTLIAVALGKVGHPQAQTVLRRAISLREQQGRTFLNFLPLLSQSDQPTLETLNFLERLSRSTDQDVQSTAMLASGMALGRFADVDPNEAKKRIIRRATDLRTSDNPRNRTLLIKLLGNSGAPEAFSALQEIILSNRPVQERALALNALRFNKTTEAREQLQVFLKNLKNESMSLAALNALQYRELDNIIIQDINSAVYTAKSSDVRIEAVRLLWSRRSEVKNFGQELENVIRINSDPKVRRIARQFLEVM